MSAMETDKAVDLLFPGRPIGKIDISTDHRQIREVVTCEKCGMNLEQVLPIKHECRQEFDKKKSPHYTVKSGPVHHGRPPRLVDRHAVLAFLLQFYWEHLN
ncbi:hypothetical protein PsorP6_010210 [Peronosclerospora sorghi]|uniref:Uncharacterized protein n=1 Tax=Peronosclerospora sorghi TaxID=230839 RepID=A0ACC0VTD0_9STRA|nr:hypothetical protein PsorP6_010210 [Peronosclerospora sorghi]